RACRDAAWSANADGLGLFYRHPRILRRRRAGNRLLDPAHRTDADDRIHRHHLHGTRAMAISFSSPHGGYEYPMLLLFVYAAIFFRGAGRCSIDRMIGKEF